MNRAPEVCIKCGETVDYLEVFPGPRCLPCWSSINHPMPTAGEVVAMWGGTTQSRMD